MLSKTLRSQIDEALMARKEWEVRQGTFYQMRHDGIPRRNIPWPGASNLHFPLIDSFIDKLKPFYVQQLYGSETLAKFVSCKPSTSGKAESAERWFDYTIKQDSNFESELQVACDWMLQGGFSVLKIYWDNARKRIAFDAVEPEYIIVPQWTRGLQDADWVVQVHRYSEDAFERDPLFKGLSPQDIKKITGNGSNSDDAAQVRTQYKARREGLTYGCKGEIVIWEVWRRDKAKDQWIVEFHSPVNREVEIRQPQINPYRHKQLPFVEFQYEVKDKGYYASRGIAERLAPLETSITRLWNEFHDSMVLVNRPLFKAPKGTTVQGTSLTWAPGDIITADIERLNSGEISIDFEREMNNIRTIAEYLINMPDFGALGEEGGQPTATKTRAVVASTTTTNNLRSRVFRKSLSKVYNQAWSLCAEFLRPGSYLVDGQSQDMDPDGMSDDYVIHPSGSADAWNQAQETTDAVNLFQLLNGDQMTDQLVLRKNMGNKMDPALCRTLFVDPGERAKEQSSKTLDDITTMIVTGFPVTPGPAEDNAVAAATAGMFVLTEAQKGHMYPPDQAKLILAYIMGNVQAATQKKNPQLPQVMQGLAPAVTLLNQAATAGTALPQQTGTGHIDSNQAQPAQPVAQANSL